MLMDRGVCVFLVTFTSRSGLRAAPLKVSVSSCEDISEGADVRARPDFARES